MQVWKFRIINNADANKDKITLKQTFLRYTVNCGMLALLGMPLFLIYVDSKKENVYVEADCNGVLMYFLIIF